MFKPSRRLRKDLERALGLWRQSLDLAGPFLVSRGIGPRAAEHFRLGVVSCGDSQWDRFRGRLAVPYMDRLGVVGFQFRCIQGHDCKVAGHKKYLQPDDQKVGLFNVVSLDSDEDTAHLCEGELDAVVLWQLVLGPVVAVAGVDKWMPHFPYHFTGFDRVCVWADGDEAGRGLRRRVRDCVPNADLMALPAGDDVGSLFCRAGASAVAALWMEEPGLALV